MGWIEFAGVNDRDVGRGVLLTSIVGVGISRLFDQSGNKYARSPGIIGRFVSLADQW
jgi:hypothetical protein